jgi:penicillin-binding protein 1A
MDAWFAGYTQTMVAVVWIGFDKPKKLGDKETGGGLALPVWIDYMGTAIAGTPVIERSPPEGMVNMGGEWYYEEYTPGTGVRSIRPDENDYVPPDAADDSEKQGILDLFGDTPAEPPQTPTAP